ncbi:MAG: aminopeptidase P family protein [Actinobacteria bacterium]|nr:aminopeptidase P family protein [Actinomycetota bacterium]
MPASHAVRRDLVRKQLRAAGLDAGLITSLVNVRYLTGFTGSNGALLIWTDGSTADRAVFGTDGRYDTQRASEVPELEPVLARECAVALAARAGRDGARLVGFEAHQVTVDGLAALVAAAEGVELRSLGRVVEGLRVRKSEQELLLLQRACDIADVALADLLLTGGLRPGRTEREVGRELDGRMLDLGAHAVSFETIIAGGPNSAIPHHHPTDRVLVAGDLVKLDFGAEYEGYHSDMTRTVVLGEPAGWQQEVYDLVVAAQRAGREALAVDADVREVDQAARAVIEGAGYGEQFCHGLGHGVGLEIHEAPTLSPLGAGTLAELTTVTVEPGVYLAGRGGVRIEDTLVVRGTGPELLTQTTKDLVIL